MPSLYSKVLCMPEEIDFRPTMFERTEFHRRKEQVLFQKQPSLRSFSCPSFRQGKVEAADAGPGQLATTLQPILFEESSHRPRHHGPIPAALVSSKSVSQD